MKKIALFGGSFNPIQNGHVKVISEVVDSGLVDEVWVMPCRDHSFGKVLASAEDRVSMIQLSVVSSQLLDMVKVCREELDYEGKSYAYDTVMRLKQKYDYDFYWICGSDILYEFDRWHRYEDLNKEIEFLVFERGGYPVSKAQLSAIRNQQLEKAKGADVSVVSGVPFHMNVVGFFRENSTSFSSTEVRRKILEGESLLGVVPGRVEDYIREKGLYKV